MIELTPETMAALKGLVLAGVAWSARELQIYLKRRRELPDTPSAAAPMGYGINSLGHNGNGNGNGPERERWRGSVDAGMSGMARKQDEMQSEMRAGFDEVKEQIEALGDKVFARINQNSERIAHLEGHLGKKR